MLLRFGVANFKSINEYQEMSLIATSLKDDMDFKLQSKAIKEQVLPTAAIYGANGSGKSNFILAIQSMIDFILNSQSSNIAKSSIQRTPFKLNNNRINEPTTFDLDFVINEIHFHYGYKFDDHRVLEEWLYHFKISQSGRKNRTVLFHRNSKDKDEFYFGKKLKGQNRQIESLTRDNSLFLSAAAQNNHELLTKVYLHLRSLFRIRTSSNKGIIASRTLAEYEKNSALKEKVIMLLKASDTGIRNIKIVETEVDDDTKDIFSGLLKVLNSNKTENDTPITHEDLVETVKYQTKLAHNNNENEETLFDLSEESLGTQELISLAFPIFQKLESGGVFLIDELDASLHTLLCREIVKLFNDPSTNPNGAQLIFSTHDTNLLCSGLLRRDEIWLTEKNANGETVIYPISDLKINSRDNMEVGYLQGRFGGVPFLESMDKLHEILKD